GGDTSLENQPGSAPRRRLYHRSQLVNQRQERYRLARQKISVEQVARISSLHRCAKSCRRNVWTGDQPERCATAAEIRAKWLAPRFAVANERRLLALPPLHPAFQRRVHRRQRPICPA